MRNVRHFRQNGFSIVSAIFLLVVLSVLGASMLTFSTVQHATAAQDIQGARAYQAARAGIEWGIYQALIVGGGAACPASPTNLPALAADLASFAVVVTCASTAYNEAGVAGTVFLITATATSGAVGSANYIERRLEVRV